MWKLINFFNKVCYCTTDHIVFLTLYSLVHVLLDEIVGSTIHRCLDPITMEPSVSRLKLLEFSTHVTQSDASAAIVSHRLLSSAMRSNDDNYWPVHSFMLSLHDIRRLPRRRLPFAIPYSMYDSFVACRDGRHGRIMITCDG